MSLRELLPNASEEAVDMLSKLLVFDPNKRMTAEEALRHPFVERFHDPDTEPACDRIITVPIDDNTKCAIGEYRSVLGPQSCCTAWSSGR